MDATRKWQGLAKEVKEKLDAIKSSMSEDDFMLLLGEIENISKKSDIYGLLQALAVRDDALLSLNEIMLCGTDENARVSAARTVLAYYRDEIKRQDQKETRKKDKGKDDVQQDLSFWEETFKQE